MSSDHQHDIFGTVKNVYNLDVKLLIAAKVISCVVGIPLNVFVAVNIIRLRRLHSKPRNIFLLAIIFSNLLIFIPTIIPEAKGFSLAEGPNKVFPRKNLSPAVQTAEAELKCYTWPKSADLIRSGPDISIDSVYRVY